MHSSNICAAIVVTMFSNVEYRKFFYYFFKGQSELAKKWRSSQDIWYLTSVVMILQCMHEKYIYFLVTMNINKTILIEIYVQNFAIFRSDLPLRFSIRLMKLLLEILLWKKNHKNFKTFWFLNVTPGPFVTCCFQ